MLLLLAALLRNIFKWLVYWLARCYLVDLAGCHAHEPLMLDKAGCHARERLVDLAGCHAREPLMLKQGLLAWLAGYLADCCARERLNDANGWLAIAQVQTQMAFPINASSKLPLIPKIIPVDNPLNIGDFLLRKKSDVSSIPI
jgi:hypothetical protein